ncbi:MAG: DinB family protein [Dehalococcoidales bacterium]|nr:DinB family protein [Dehalococcoidales bacterium]
MEMKDFIKGALDRAKQGTTRAVDGLSHNELIWRPGPECNSIGLILFHQTRFEDSFVQGRIVGNPQVWESDKWYEKFNMPASESGSGYTAEQLAAFRVPELKDLLGYADAVRAKTLEYLKSAPNNEFDRVINMPRFGDVAVGALLALVIVHMAQHAGEIAYLRGVQRGMNK